MLDPQRHPDARADEGHGSAGDHDQDVHDQDIRQLVGTYYQSVFRYAFRLSRSEADAEDLAQQTFLIAQQKLHQVRDADKVGRWLFAVLRSCFFKSRRKEQRAMAAGIEIDVAEIPDGQGGDELIDQELLQTAIHELPEKFRLVLLMFYFEQLSYKEIAADLEISIGTVMSRLSRAKARLRGHLLETRESVHPLVARHPASSLSERSS